MGGTRRQGPLAWKCLPRDPCTALPFLGSPLPAAKGGYCERGQQCRLTCLGWREMEAGTGRGEPVHEHPGRGGGIPRCACLERV